MRANMNDLEKLIERNFPISSQTSRADKIILLQSIAAIKSKKDKFKYIEIGSYLGGSLIPFLLEEACELVVSVDERERQQPDERGAIYNYEGVTNQAMIKNIVSHKVSINKMITHDGSISTLNCSDNKFDLAFIDGEHTDVACVRDFVWTLPMMNKDAILLFHDSTIVYKALAVIREIIDEKRISFQLLKSKISEISILLLGDFAKIDVEKLFGDFEEWTDFQQKSEISMLSSVISNRVKFKVGYTIDPTPVFKV